MDSTDIALRNIFASSDVQRRAKLLFGGQKLIHYCSADTALRIIKNREIWLRNVRVMNDVMEINHGFNLILRSMQPRSDTAIETGIRAIATALNSIHPSIAEDTFERFRAWSAQIQNETYVTCLSEHLPHENEDGRLSMWRNYAAGNAGVGLVINTSLFASSEDRLGIFSSPVHYHTDLELDESLVQVAQQITMAAGQLAQIPPETIIGHYFLMLRTIAHGSKHPGFQEEREWRVFNTLGLDDLGKLEIHSESVGGIPQRVLKLRVDGSVPGFSVPELVDSVLIGPSPYQQTIAGALIDELRKADKPNAHTCFKYSPIPLRT